MIGSTFLARSKPPVKMYQPRLWCNTLWRMYSASGDYTVLNLLHRRSAYVHLPQLTLRVIRKWYIVIRAVDAGGVRLLGRQRGTAK